MKIAFTGHRPDKLGGYSPCPEHRKIRAHINQFLTQQRQEHGDQLRVISGCALGIDQFAMEVSQSLGIGVIAAVPFEGFNNKWPTLSIRHLNILLEKCEEVHVVCESGYSAGKLQERNEWMVNQADLVVAYWDGSKGGTKNCIDYAKSQNRDLVVFDLKEVLK